MHMFLIFLLTDTNTCCAELGPMSHVMYFQKLMNV